MNKSYLILLLLLISTSCSKQENPTNPVIQTRYDLIPENAVKMNPQNDTFPPVIHSSQWNQPEPLDSPVNSAGIEDSPFITPQGDWFFFFFTPDASQPAQNQIVDGFSGIWWSMRSGNNWTEPVRVKLSSDLALDGAEFIANDTLWFGSVRTGNYGEIDIYFALYNENNWTGWTNAGETLNSIYDIGEFHITSDGDTLYFGSNTLSGYGQTDLWLTERSTGSWSSPVNLGGIINSTNNENQPFVTEDKTELWFTSESRLGYPGPAVFRSVKTDSGWSQPQEIISNFSGEPCLDNQGNIYFTHHYCDSTSRIIESDIYIAIKR
ncbi:MAG: hypothetical protein ACP5FK_08110 [bacterium]